jgi:hypothetical protein
MTNKEELDALALSVQEKCNGKYSGGFDRGNEECRDEGRLKRASGEQLWGWSSESAAGA